MNTEERIKALESALARAVFEAEGWKDEAHGTSLDGEPWHDNAKALLGDLYSPYSADPLRYYEGNEYQGQPLTATEITRECLRILEKSGVLTLACSERKV